MKLHFTIFGKISHTKINLQYSLSVITIIIYFTKIFNYELLDLCKAELKNFEIMLVGGLGRLFSALNNSSNLIKISIVIPV